VSNPARPVPAPHWGKAARPDAFIAWSRSILEIPSGIVTLDLAPRAPADWDGQFWLGLGVDTVCRGLRIEATLSLPK